MRWAIPAEQLRSAATRERAGGNTGAGLVRGAGGGRSIARGLGRRSADATGPWSCADRPSASGGRNPGVAVVAGAATARPQARGVVWSSGRCDRRLTADERAAVPVLHDAG